MTVKTAKQRPKARIKTEMCDGNPWCPSMKSCPAGAIIVKESSGFSLFKRVVLEVDEDKCTGCGKCVSYCAHKAVKIV